MNDARYFTHDDNARNDPKIKALMKKYGVEGYGRFWIIVETMRATKGHKINIKEYILESLAEEMKCTIEEIKKFLDDCVKFDLFVKEDSFYYSESLLERLSFLSHLRAARQRGAYAMHEKAGHNITKDPQETNDL